MIVVGIPTYNEAGNIEQLVRSIDAAATCLGLSIVIVSADSASTDETVAIFTKVNTHCQKVSITNARTGKGVNIRSILNFITTTPEVEGCMLIDGDIRSFDITWLAKQAALLREGYDYVVPNYARNFQEGNTTNHFAYPLLGMRFGAQALRQPLAGDFGISVRLARAMLARPWHSYSYTYGIDIFLTMHALHGDYAVTEVMLDKKLHAPSFDKMIPMFREVAASYYATIRQLPSSGAIHGSPPDHVQASTFLQTEPIPPAAIRNLRSKALKIARRTVSLVPALAVTERVSQEMWTDVLLAHERAIMAASPAALADSLLPWFLLRTSTYLEDCRDSEAASREIQQQYDLIVRQWAVMA